VEYSLYVVLAALLFLHWRAAAGRNLDQLFEADNHLHHQVHRVIAKHPAGGNWREHKAWMADDTG
jgi:hypothetical protein